MPDFHRGRCFLGMTAHTTALFQNKIRVFGGRNGLQALSGVRTLDVGSSLEGMEWEEAVTGDRRSRGASGLLRAGVIWLISRRNVMIAVGGRDDASDSRIYGILASVCSFARPRAHPRLHEETYQTQF